MPKYSVSTNNKKKARYEYYILVEVMRSQKTDVVRKVKGSRLTKPVITFYVKFESKWNAF